MHKIIGTAIALGLSIMSAIPALAQTSLPEYTLKITSAEADQLGNAIANLPYKDAVPLMNKLRSQILEQQQAAEKAKAAKEEPAKEEPKQDAAPPAK